MEENRIQNQIAIYKTDKKLCELNDKLKQAPAVYYAHMHAQGEKMEDGSRLRSCVGIVLQDYSKGTGDKTVRVTANLPPEFFAYALSRVEQGAETFDYQEDKIFGEPDQNGFSKVTKLMIKRASVGTDGKPRNYPWCIKIENGTGVKESTEIGGVHMKKGSYQMERSVYVNINDYDFFTLMYRTVRYIQAWEITSCPRVIRDARQAMELQREAAAGR